MSEDEKDQKERKEQCPASWDGHQCRRQEGHEGQHSAPHPKLDKVAWS